MRRALISSLVLGLAAAPAAAETFQVVQFVDGRALRVQAVVPDGEMTFLSLDGGGQLAVPSTRILNWRELGVPDPAPGGGAMVGEPEAWRAAAGDFAPLIADAAERHGLDPVLLTAVAQTESAFDPSAVSPKGARGLLQLMPETARRFGVRDSFDATQNVDGGAAYLSWLLERYSGRTELALAGYNAGEGAVDRYQGVPPFSETRTYVQRVLAGAERLVGSAR
jgi:soluble lytic murein transglycosylase-like protein